MEAGKALSNLIDYELKHGSWRLKDVMHITSYPVIRRFIKMGFVKRVGGGRMNPTYHTTEKARNKTGKLMAGQVEVNENMEIPADLFDGIIGLDDIKEIFWMAIKASAPVHILLIGKPSSAKSILLYSLERLPRSAYVDSAIATKMGIGKVLIEKRPKYLLMDEFEKMDGKDYAALLTVMSEGRYVKTTSRARVDIEMPTYVFAAGNSDENIPEPILERFDPFIFHLPEYDRVKAMDVIGGILKDKVDPDMALYISDVIVDRLGSRNPRAAIQIARMAKSKEDVDRIVKTIRNY